ncbi:MAG TPA: hypothetical protein VN436_08345, partial [Holophaga sp.]|nr:hypothetical protein [Holophaga sp.]
MAPVGARICASPSQWSAITGTGSQGEGMGGLPERKAGKNCIKFKKPEFSWFSSNNNYSLTMLRLHLPRASATPAAIGVVG